MSYSQQELKINEQGREIVYKFLATLSELKLRGQLTRWIDGHDILLYEYDDGYKAISNICRHFGGPVGYHKMNNGIFTCLWHNWRYSAKDGSCLTHKGLPLRTYKIKVSGDNIFVDLES